MDGSGLHDSAVKAFQNARESLLAADGDNALAIASVDLQLGIALAKQGVTCCHVVDAKCSTLSCQVVRCCRVKVSGVNAKCQC